LLDAGNLLAQDRDSTLGRTPVTGQNELAQNRLKPSNEGSLTIMNSTLHKLQKPSC